jgi:beta-glucanase (GH16 family)
MRQAKWTILTLLGILFLPACIGQWDNVNHSATTAPSPSATPHATSTRTPEPTHTPTPTATNTGELPGWDLVWRDEFDSAEIDRENWTFDIGGNGWGNSELECYTDRPENVRIEDGVLIIEAREEEYENCDYTSARLKTLGLGSWEYGRIEAYIKLPKGQGIWPAFWMLGDNIERVGWPRSGEIDIMEFLGNDPTTIYGSIHGPGYAEDGFGGVFYTEAGGDLTDEYHTFAIEWTPYQIQWFADNEAYFQITPDEVSGRWVFDRPFFIILNLAVGGEWPGYPDETTLFPQQMYVDYVRVYQKEHYLPPTANSE